MIIFDWFRGENIQRISKNIFWLFLDNVLRFGSNFIIVIFMARYLGPEKFGMYNYVIAFTALFSVFASLGLNDIVVRDIINAPQNKNQILGTAFYLKLISGIIVFFISTIAIIIIRPNEPLLHWMTAIMSMGYIFNASSIIELWFQSQVLSKYTVFAKNIVLPITLIIKFFLIYLKFPIIFFIYVTLLEVIISSFFIFIIYQIKEDPLTQWKFQKNRARQLLLDSWPLILSGLAILIYMRLDQIMIGMLLGDEQVGVYSAAMRISEIWYFIPMIIIPSVFPILLKIKNTNKSLYLNRMQLLYTFFTWSSIISALFVTITSTWIISFIYGAQYLEASTILSIHMWTGLFVAWELVIQKDILADNLTKLTLFRTITGCSANIALNLLLIPLVGIIGSAIATLISYGVSIISISFIPSKREQLALMLKSFLVRY